MNLFDYLGRELATFDEKPLNNLDSALLTQLCMVRGGQVIPAERVRTTTGPLSNDRVDRLADIAYARRVRPAHVADLYKAELFDGMFSGLVPDRIRQELAMLVASPRFRTLELRDYSSITDDNQHIQFSATTFVWRGAGGHDFAYIAYRGTDESITGWRENFDMAITPPVPAQTLALNYLESVARHLPGRLYVGGHSKGANLATYAALRCSPEVRSRIERVWDLDGPGFKQGFVGADEFARLEGRITRIVPTESFVGMLMETHAPTLVVESDAHGIDQHSPFTWLIDGDDFVYAPALSRQAELSHSVMNEWISTMSDEEIPRVVDALFRAIEASGAKDATQVFAGGTQTAALVLEAARNMDAQTRDVLLPALANLSAIMVRQNVANVATLLQRRSS
ncbi:MAG: Mbeg1-like protein [Tractidigestivibacter sp.]|jgi:hypothetical protein|uniref:Mbeg1-like protein n=1 Tax=Tractidigestivibacter sp. TaxID=2847320 RepID=UPI003D8EB564